MNQHKSRRLTEDAICAVINAVGSDALKALDQHKGFDVQRKMKANRLRVVAEASTPEYIADRATGNNWVQLQIGVVSHKDDSDRDDHGELAADLEDVLFRPDIDDLLCNKMPSETIRAAGEIWLDHCDVSTVNRTGHDVDSVTDRTGNGNDATPGAGGAPETGRIKLQGGNVLTFEDNSLEAGPIAIGAGGDLAVHILARIDEIGSSSDGLISFTSGSGDDFELISGASAQFDGVLDASALGAGSLALSGGPYKGWHLFSITFDFSLSTIKVCVDGSPAVVSTDYTTALDPSDLTLQVFSDTAGTGRINKGAVAEVMVSADASGTSRVEAEGAIMHKWGLQRQLPDGHLYRKHAPSLPIADFPDNFSVCRDTEGHGTPGVMIEQFLDKAAESEMWSWAQMKLKVKMEI